MIITNNYTMSKNSELDVHFQEQEAHNGGRAFHDYRNAILNSPSPKDMQGITESALRALLTEMGASPARIATIMGMVETHASAVKLQAMDAISNTKVWPDSNGDHILNVAGFVS